MSRMEDRIVPQAAAAAAERRRHARVEIPLKARFLTKDGAERPCLVANISAGGALLRAVSPPAEDELVVLYIDEVGRFEGKVVRSGKHSFAVDYRGKRARSQKTADALTCTLHNQSHRFDRRALPRIKQDAPALVTYEDGSTQPCSILDISLTGASIEIDPKPPLGAQLRLGKTAAKVVRRHESGVSVVFSGPAVRMEQAIKDTAAAGAPEYAGAALASSFGRKGVTA